MENTLNSNFSRNLSLSRPLIAVDWGTTSLRAAFITNEQVQEERSSEQGIMSVPPGEFPNVLSQICAQWLDNEDVLILISGMAGSAQGWQLAPYCPCPVTSQQLAHQLHWINPNKIAIVPGLSIRLEHAPDVIRGEHLIADYTRKGFIDGRSARLMTVTVRPGRPNGAASSFFSGIIREPLNGETAICPVLDSVSHPVSTPSLTIQGLKAVYEASRESFLGRSGMNLPALNVTVKDMLQALENVAGKSVRSLVKFELNERIASIVSNWPKGTNSTRAVRLGLHSPKNFESVIEEYIADQKSN